MCEHFTLEEFAARCKWLEHMRLRQYLGDYEAHKHLRKVIRDIKAGRLGIERTSEWSAMVEHWYQEYSIDVSRIEYCRENG